MHGNSTSGRKARVGVIYGIAGMVLALAAHYLADPPGCLGHKSCPHGPWLGSWLQC